MGNLITILLLCSLVVLAVSLMVGNRRKGKRSCGCDCSGCLMDCKDRRKEDA